MKGLGNREVLRAIKGKWCWGGGRDLPCQTALSYFQPTKLASSFSPFSGADGEKRKEEMRL